MYVKQLELILKRLRNLTSNVVFGTSTPVHPDRPFKNDGWSWRNGEIDQYNAAASALMKGKGVPINDLHAVVSSDVDTYLADDQLHLSIEGQMACARAVVEHVSTFL